MNHLFPYFLGMQTAFGAAGYGFAIYFHRKAQR